MRGAGGFVGNTCGHAITLQCKIEVHDTGKVYWHGGVMPVYDR